MDPMDITRLKEVSAQYGVSVSAIIEMCLSAMLDRLYGEDGNLLPPNMFSLKKKKDNMNGFFQIKDIANWLGIEYGSLWRLLKRKKGHVCTIAYSGRVYAKLGDVIKLYGTDKYGKKG